MGEFDIKICDETPKRDLLHVMYCAYNSIIFFVRLFFYDLFFNRSCTVVEVRKEISHDTSSNHSRLAKKKISDL